MGLDWNPLARPKRGHEAEFSCILATDLERLTPLEKDRIVARFGDISDPPFKTLDAPQVGVDPAADAWLVKQVEENEGIGPLDSAREQMLGYYVLDLLPPNPGLPVYTSRGYEGVDRYTFRAAFLCYVRDLLGEELFHAAWTTMSASELEVYGDRILAIARGFADQHTLQYLEDQRDAPEVDEGSAQSRAHILFSAAKWCLWWSGRGHGLEPYF